VTLMGKEWFYLMNFVNGQLKWDLTWKRVIEVRIIIISLLLLLLFNFFNFLNFFNILKFNFILALHKKFSFIQPD
jgi:hypothetical protein